MGKLSLSLFALGVAACGSDNNNPADAKVVIVPDAKMIDAPKVFMDAPPVNYDFTCFGMAPPTTATDPITAAGVTQTINIQTQTLEPVPNATVEVYKTGTATAVNSVTSSAAGTFTTGNITTGGVPLDGYIRASKTAYRTTFVYPPNKIVASLASVPALMISDQVFALLAAQAGGQDDTTSGVLLVAITDCALMPIAGADATARQGTTNIVLQDLSALIPGTYAALNVPEGDVTVGGAYNSMTFPEHTAKVFKKPDGVGAEGTITSTAVVPGPF